MRGIETANGHTVSRPLFFSRASPALRPRRQRAAELQHGARVNAHHHYCTPTHRRLPRRTWCRRSSSTSTCATTPSRTRS